MEIARRSPLARRSLRHGALLVADQDFPIFFQRDIPLGVGVAACTGVPARAKAAEHVGHRGLIDVSGASPDDPGV